MSKPGTYIVGGTITLVYQVQCKLDAEDEDAAYDAAKEFFEEKYTDAIRDVIEANRKKIDRDANSNDEGILAHDAGWSFDNSEVDNVEIDETLSIPEEEEEGEEPDAEESTDAPKGGEA